MDKRKGLLRLARPVDRVGQPFALLPGNLKTTLGNVTTASPKLEIPNIVPFFTRFSAGFIEVFEADRFKTPEASLN
jgi:hypothetical protein